MIKRQKTIIAGIIAVGLFGGAGIGVAQNDVIAQRQAILKDFGDVSKAPGAMLKGERPFDLALVQKALSTYSTGSSKLTGLFPDNSKTGGDTAALPRIWDEKTRFNGLFEKLGSDSAAAAAAIKDEATFKANFGKIFGDCKACHDDYRAKKS